MPGREFAVMRSWEYKLYCLYNELFAAIEKLLYAFHDPLVKIREAIGRGREYYLADNGTIKVRRTTGPGGVYTRMNGKLVKIGQSVAKIDDYSVIPWRECNAGYYDEEFGCYVESKQHYRQLMKEHGLIPAEKTNYCGSADYRRRQELEYKALKNRRASEKAFTEAVAKAAAMGLSPEGNDDD